MSRHPADLPRAEAAVIAAHRFGLGEPDLRTVGSEPLGWLVAQIGPAEPQRGDNLANGAEGVKRFAEFVRDQRGRLANRAANTAMTGEGPMANGASPGMTAGTAAAGGMAAGNVRSTEQQFGEHFRSIVQADVRVRLVTAAMSNRPFNERLAWFWSNHFTVSMAKASARGIVGAFEREAIRPHIGGNFETLLKAAVKHAGMLRYLDNDQSAGPQSAVVRRLARRPRGEGEPGPRLTGLNENLAREVLELHTLGASSEAAGAAGGGRGRAYGGWGGYTQADVTEFARVLTGWRVPLAQMLRTGSAAEPTRFDAGWHDPGTKTVLGKRYREGDSALDEVLADLAHHPSTARFVSFKLARHFVADEPPAELVGALAAAFLKSGGDLPTLYRTLIESPLAWATAPAKLKTPEEFVVSSARLLSLGEQAFARAPDGGIGALGQRVQAAPSPAGWPDRAEDWLGPDAVWKRVEWATRVANLVGRQVDARALARASLGPRLTDETTRQLERAADGPQALALLLLAPEFQRR
ncbi:MAG: DUF1800 domain-containing protein [Burkholderiales bacterium]|nr:DUF1800 domain-containing protein [Burkholderiales bacterium]